MADIRKLARDLAHEVECLPPNPTFCDAPKDLGQRFSVPAGPADAGATPIAGGLVRQFTDGDNTPYFLNASLANPSNVRIDNTVIWVVDEVQRWAGGSVGAYSPMDVSRNRKCFVGTSLTNVPVIMPFNLYVFGVDGGAAFDAIVAWKLNRQSSLGGGGTQREQTPRVVPGNIAVGSYGPVNPAVGNDLYYPIASELKLGLVEPDVSGFGWRPDTLNVRKTDTTDLISIFIAHGAASGGKPEFARVRLDANTDEWTGPVDPSWSGGVIIGNDGGQPTHKCLLTWWKS